MLNRADKTIKTALIITVKIVDLMSNFFSIKKLGGSQIYYKRQNSQWFFNLLLK